MFFLVKAVVYCGRTLNWYHAHISYLFPKVCIWEQLPLSLLCAIVILNSRLVVYKASHRLGWYCIFLIRRLICNIFATFLRRMYRIELLARMTRQDRWNMTYVLSFTLFVKWDHCQQIKSMFYRYLQVSFLNVVTVNIFGKYKNRLKYWKYNTTFNT